MGVSFDSPEKNKDWADDEGFEFELWSDEERALAVYYGAASSTSATWADRITVLMDEDGDVVLEYRENVNVGTHPAQVLEDCQTLFGGR